MAACCLGCVEGAGEVGGYGVTEEGRVDPTNISVTFPLVEIGKETYSRNSANLHTPALLTKTSNRPNSDTVSAINFFPVSGCVTSPETVRNLFSCNPVISTASLLMDSRSASSFGPPKWLMATLAPWRRYSRAMAWVR